MSDDPAADEAIAEAHMRAAMARVQDLTDLAVPHLTGGDLWLFETQSGALLRELGALYARARGDAWPRQP